MALLTPKDFRISRAIGAIGFTNPFLPERIEREKEALGSEFVEFQPFLQYRADNSVSEMFPNSTALRVRCEKMLNRMRERLVKGEPASQEELEVYENLALYFLYSRYMSKVLDLPMVRFRIRPEDNIPSSYKSFTRDHEHYFQLPDRKLPYQLDRDVLFAGLFQVERAFFHIFRHVVGASMAAAQLRASIWQSIFTHDMKRYLRVLHQHMGDIPTLITGPSGTGKDLVAQSIAYSRFVEFDSSRRCFAINYQESLIGLNLSAIAPTLIESELFGHVKGAFTDAKSERKGYLDESNCSRWGTVFMDEIGELDAPLQVKLLRVLQNREFQRIGDSATRKFVGKIVAATNRNLEWEMEKGTFRQDFYYRLCADRIETPSLAEQIHQSPDDLVNFVRFIAMRLLPGLEDEAGSLTNEVVNWIHENLGLDYPWPGNIRELEQCIRSIMIRGVYVPAGGQKENANSNVNRFLSSVEAASLSRDEMLRGYLSLVYAKTGSYRATGRQAGIDWRTAKELVDLDRAKEFSEEL